MEMRKGRFKSSLDRCRRRFPKVAWTRTLHFSIPGPEKGCLFVLQNCDSMGLYFDVVNCTESGLRGSAEILWVNGMHTCTPDTTESELWRPNYARCDFNALLWPHFYPPPPNSVGTIQVGGVEFQNPPAGPEMTPGSLTYTKKHGSPALLRTDFRQIKLSTASSIHIVVHGCLFPSPIFTSFLCEVKLTGDV